MAQEPLHQMPRPESVGGVDSHQTQEVGIKGINMKIGMRASIAGIY
jgi:hypothetical protein